MLTPLLLVWNSGSDSFPSRLPFRLRDCKCSFSPFLSVQCNTSTSPPHSSLYCRSIKQLRHVRPLGLRRGSGENHDRIIQHFSVSKGEKNFFLSSVAHMRLQYEMYPQIEVPQKHTGLTPSPKWERAPPQSFVVPLFQFLAPMQRPIARQRATVKSQRKDGSRWAGFVNDIPSNKIKIFYVISKTTAVLSQCEGWTKLKEGSGERSKSPEIAAHAFPPRARKKKEDGLPAAKRTECLFPGKSLLLGTFRWAFPVNAVLFRNSCEICTMQKNPKVVKVRMRRRRRKGMTKLQLLWFKPKNLLIQGLVMEVCMPCFVDGSGVTERLYWNRLTRTGTKI